jgi:PHP domain
MNSVALDQDFHVHSTFSDGASTLAENVAAARDRELRTLCLVDHVRRDTAWVPEFVAAVGQYRHQPGCGSWPAWRPRFSTPPAGSTRHQD